MRHTLRSALSLLSGIALFVGVPACSGGGGGGGGGSDLSLDGIAPAMAPVGALLSLTGQDFGSEQDDSTVTVGGVAAVVQTWTDNEIVITVPDVFPGSRAVSVTVGEDSSEQAFTVVLPRRAYVSNGITNNTVDDAVTVLSVSAAGVLEEIAGSPFSTGFPNGFGFGGTPGNLALDTANRRLFVSGSAGIGVFDIDGETGALGAVAGSPFSFPGNRFMFGVAVTPDGANVYATLCQSSAVAHFVVGSGGALAAANVPTYDTATDCVDEILITPDGTRLYTSDGLTMWGFTIGAGGALTPIAGTPVDHSVGQSYGKTLSPDGTRLYAASYDSEIVLGYEIGATGGLTALPGSPYSTPGVDSQPNGIALTPDASVAYVALWNSSGIAIMDAAVDGALTYRGKVPTMEEPAPVRVSADGSLLVVAGQQGHAVEAFAIAGDGALTSTGALVLDSSYYPQALIVTGF